MPVPAVTFEPFPDAARRQFGPLWPAFREQWSGFASDGPLWEGDPEAIRGARRLLHACYVAGMRHPATVVVSPDYQHVLRRFWRWEEPDHDDGRVATILGMIETSGHPAGRPFAFMSGRTFQWQVDVLEAKGHAVRPMLNRSRIGGAELRYLREIMRKVRLTDADQAELLCDFGGGVYRAEHLDEDGFALAEVAVEMIMAGYWGPGRARP